MDNTNITRVLAAVWEDPGRLFGGRWKNNGKSNEYLGGVDGWNQRGAVRLLQQRNGDGITVFLNHGSGRPGSTYTKFFDFVMERDGLATTWEAIQHAADVYGVPLKLTAEQREQINRVQLARAVFPELREALRLNPDGAAAQYLTNTRRFGEFGDNFGELTAESLERAKNGLKLRNTAYNAADLDALGLTERNARAGYNVVIPYYSNGQIFGFLLRNVKTGVTPKILAQPGMKRAGYCRRLENGKPAFIVEGELDAIRLQQAAAVPGSEISNVIAMGRANPGDDLAALLRSHGITSVVYVPDIEFNDQGQQKTDIITAAVRAFQGLRIDGEPVITSLHIAELPAPDGANLNGVKIDADSYGAEHGPEDLAGSVVLGSVPVWFWELDRLAEWEREHRGPTGTAPVDEIQARINAIYTQQNPYNRELIRQRIQGGPLASVLAPYGITAAALDDVDEWDRKNKFYDQIRQGAADLNKAIQEHRDRETIGALVRKLDDARGADARDEWEQQLNEPFDAELDAIKNQPETLGTVWEVGTLNKQTHKYNRREPVEFWPADITVICAPTSHGKTMFLFQAAINAVQDPKNGGKLFLYVSCEENKRQLTERALNVALDIPTISAAEYAINDTRAAFITGTRKRAIKTIIRGGRPPMEYQADTFDGGDRWERLKRRVNAEIERYRDEIRPRLKFVHTEASAESITANILYYVEQYRAAGVEVGAVFVDYMQLLTADARNYSRHDELKDICKALKDCAARTEIPFIIAAQLNREVLRTGPKDGGGIDSITVANIGEGADIERIAHDIFLLWQIDKTSLNPYLDKSGDALDLSGRFGIRSKRLFRAAPQRDQSALNEGYLYVEQLKARDGVAFGWGLFPFDGERGQIRGIDTDAMEHTLENPQA